MNPVTHAMILAAGRGTRMRELTDHCPKPLLEVAGKSLIEYHIQALAKAGIQHIVINTAYLGHMLEAALGDGSRWGVNIQYSHEQELGLETAGGIINALPLLGEEPFIVVNGDVWSDYDFAQLKLGDEHLAKLVLVNNPEHNPKGDFAIDADKLLSMFSLPRYTFSGISIYHPDFFEGLPNGFLALREPLRQGIQKGCISAEYYSGDWQDIGTPERLAELEQQLTG